MRIEEAFKVFGGNMLNNKINNKNLSIFPTSTSDVWDMLTKTQFLDLSYVKTDEISTLDISDLSIPFEICFVKTVLADSEDNTSLFPQGDIFSFFWDTPYSIIGYCLIFVEETLFATSLYTIHRETSELEFYVNSEFINSIGESDLNFLIKAIIQNTVAKLQIISPKKNILYKTCQVKTQIRKRSQKIKETIKKPIYIYIDKKDEVKLVSKLEKKHPFLEKVTTWFVRGHWRKLDNPIKRGKNAQGDYIVEGFTWVKPFIKGNRNLTPIPREYIAL